MLIFFAWFNVMLINFSFHLCLYSLCLFGTMVMVFHSHVCFFSPFETVFLPYWPSCLFCPVRFLSIDLPALNSKSNISSRHKMCSVSWG